MLRAYKTEINLTPEQARKVRQNIGVCRWLYNEFIATNIKRREAGLKFMSAFDFDKHINHDVKTLGEFSWINDCGSKARKKAICNAEMAFKNFFAKHAGFPRFKKRRDQNVSLYFPKNNHGDWTVARNWVQVPTLKHVWLKEYGYLPVDGKVKSGVVSQKADRFFVSVLVDEPEREYAKPTGEGIGIDLGLKDFAILSDGEVFKNINKSRAVKRVKKKLKREQRRLSKKLIFKKKRGEKSAAYSANVAKNVLEVQKIYRRLNNIRRNFMHLVISAIMKLSWSLKI